MAVERFSGMIKGSRPLIGAGVLLFLLGACTYRHVEPPPGEGTVYVLNTVTDWESEPHAVFINEHRVAVLRPGEFTWIHLLPGRYAVAVKGSEIQGRTLSSQDVDVSPGAVRFLVYDEEKREDYLIEYSKEHARNWLRARRYVSSHHIARDFKN
ncbi:MAG: DUF2846 domain-containing protein [Pseudomonadota bacterium]